MVGMYRITTLVLDITKAKTHFVACHVTAHPLSLPHAYTASVCKASTATGNLLRPPDIHWLEIVGD